MGLRTGFEAKVLLAFGMAMLVVAGLCAVTWLLAGDAVEATRQVERTQAVLHELAQARSMTLQAELSTQSYRITGDEQHLAERDAATARREAVLLTLKRLTQDDPTQQARWTELRAVVDERMALSRQIEAVRKTQGQAAASGLVAAAPLKETRARTHRLLDAMEQEERERLDQHGAERERTGRLMRLFGAGATAPLSAQLIATYLVMRRQLREAASSRRQLEDSEERLTITLLSIGEAVMATDTEGLVSRMNPVAERLTGWPATQALGRHVQEVFSVAEEGNGRPIACPVSEVLGSGVGTEP